MQTSDSQIAARMISRSSGRCFSLRLARVLAACAALVAAAGCSPGIQWRDFKYEPVQEAAARDKKLIFVYFRHWAAVNCTNFEDQVLKDEAVLAESRNFYCVPLAFDWDRPLADQFGIREIPGVAIVDPQGRVLTRLQGTITRDELIKEMARARSDYAARPAAPPPPKVIP